MQVFFPSTNFSSPRAATSSSPPAIIGAAASAMLEQAIISVLSLIGKLAAPYIINQLSPLWGSLEDELGKLKRSFLAIQSIIRNAEERQYTEDHVKSWLEELRDAVYEAEDALEAFDNECRRRRRRRQHGSIDAPSSTQKKVREFSFSLGNKAFRFKLLREVRDVAARIEMIVAEMSMFNFNPDLLPADHRKPPPSRPIFGHLVSEKDIVGRREECDYVVESLINSETRRGQDHLHNNNNNSDMKVEVISILGMGGTGKTTLAQMVYNDQRVVDHFKLRMWVSTPTDFDVRGIVNDMISSAAMEERHSSSTSMDVLEKKLKEVLREKKYLLVLDDVWNQDRQKWDNLSRILSACEGDQRSRVLVTTQNEVCAVNVMRSQYPLSLPCLSDDDSWTLFKRLAFSTAPSENLIKIGKEIVKKCGGHPAAIKVLGSEMLSKTGVNEWAAMLKIEIRILGIDNQDIFSTLKLSYNQLSPRSKQCFAFCAIFPKGYEVPKEMLIQLWMASGFVDPKSTGDEILDELTQRFFLLDVGYERPKWSCSRVEFDDIIHEKVSYRMHDLVHELAYSLIRDEFVDASHRSTITTSEIPRSIRHLLLADSLPFGGPRDYASMNPSTRMRMVLLLERESSVWQNYRNTKDLDNSIFKKLRILDLRNSNVGASELYNFIWRFEHLRYLDLSRNESIEELPEKIGRLLNLQTLKLSGCKRLRKLPDVITSMSNLVHLHIDWCTALKSMPADMGRLTSLQTLSKFVVSEEEGRGISELKHMDRLGGVLELHNLQAVANAAQADEANLSSKGRLHTLGLYWEEPIYEREREELDAQWEQAASSTPTSLEQRHVEVLEALKPPGHDRSDDSGGVLRAFRLNGYMGSQLPTWMRDDMRVFQNLKMVYMSRCRRCVRLPQLWRLPSLEVLILEHMHSIERLVDKRVEEVEEASSSTSTTTTALFPSLEPLALRGMKELSKWWPEAPQGRGGGAPLCFPKLIRLEMVSCKKMDIRNLPRLPSIQALIVDWFECYPCLSSPPFWANLASLRHLVIKNCDSAIYWPEKELRHLTSLESLHIYFCSILTAETHPMLIEDDQLRGQGRGGDIGFEEMPPIRDVVVCGCDRLDSLPQQILRLTCLKKLNISHCREMTSLGVLEMVPRALSALTDVIIASCSALESLPEGLVALRRLDIFGCPKLAAFPHDLCLRLSALWSLKLNGCPELEKRCRAGGEYWELISAIPDVKIGRDVGGDGAAGICASVLTALRPPCCSP